MLNKLKKDIINLTIIFIIAIIIFIIAFNREKPQVTVKAVATFFWLFILPGFALLYYWQDKLNFIKRFIIGTALSIAIMGIFSYYLGLLGIHLKYHGVLIPLVCLFIPVILIFRKKQ